MARTLGGDPRDDARASEWGQSGQQMIGSHRQVGWQLAQFPHQAEHRAQLAGTDCI
jgi:hypothetical protein